MISTSLFSFDKIKTESYLQLDEGDLQVCKILDEYFGCSLMCPFLPDNSLSSVTILIVNIGVNNQDDDEDINDNDYDNDLMFGITKRHFRDIDTLGEM